MIITNNFSSYPDGTEKVTELLDSIGLIKKDQIIIYIMETDDTYNRKRSSKLIDTLTRKGLIECKNGIIQYADKTNDKFEKNDNVIDAFWVLLHYAKKEMKFCAARYPSDIVFFNDDVLSEVVVCTEENIKEKMGYLKAMQKPLCKCKYYFLLLEDTINELDDEYYPDVPFSIITVSGYTKEGSPKLVFHDVLTDKESKREEKKGETESRNRELSVETEFGEEEIEEEIEEECDSEEEEYDE